MSDKKRTRKPQPPIVGDLAAVDADVKKVFEGMSGRVIAYNSVYKRLTGSCTAGIFLGQALFLQQSKIKKVAVSDAAGVRHEGFWWHTQEQWEEETGLTRYEQESARAELVRREFLSVRSAGQPGRLHFRVNRNRVIKGISDMAPTPQARLQQRHNPDCTDAASRSAASLQTSESSEEREVRDERGVNAPAAGGATPDTPSGRGLYSSEAAAEKLAGTKEDEPIKSSSEAEPPAGDNAGENKTARDQNLEHPAVKAYRDQCRITPNHQQRQDIVEAVGDAEAYAAVLRKFMGEGRNPRRVDWTLERYAAAGHPPPPLAAAAAPARAGSSAPPAAPGTQPGWFDLNEEQIKERLRKRRGGYNVQQ